MELEGLRRIRRVLSAVVALSVIALVMAKTAGPSAPNGTSVGLGASAVLVLSFGLLIVVWRKEHAADRAAFEARERAQLAMLQLQVEAARKKAARQGEPGDGT